MSHKQNMGITQNQKNKWYFDKLGHHRLATLGKFTH